MSNYPKFSNNLKFFFLFLEQTVERKEFQKMNTQFFIIVKENLDSLVAVKLHYYQHILSSKSF